MRSLCFSQASNFSLLNQIVARSKVIFAKERVLDTLSHLDTGLLLLSIVFKCYEVANVFFMDTKESVRVITVRCCEHIVGGTHETMMLTCNFVVNSH